MSDGTRIPTELKEEEAKLRHEIQLDDARTESALMGGSQTSRRAEATRPEDDEYAHAGEADPKVMVTSSREPSSKLKEFVKEVRLMIPNAQKINRGGYTTEEIIEACRRNDVTDLVIVHEHRGVPGALARGRALALTCAQTA